MSSFHRPVLQDLVISGRSSALISTACHSGENTTTGSRTLAVSSGRGRLSPPQEKAELPPEWRKIAPALAIQL